MDTNTTETSTTTERAARRTTRSTKAAEPRVSFRGRPKTEINVVVPQRRTAEDREMFGEFDGQDRLDALAAEIAESVAAKINSKGAKLASVTAYAPEYITARVTWLLSRAVS